VCHCVVESQFPHVFVATVDTNTITTTTTTTTTTRTTDPTPKSLVQTTSAVNKNK
jgi:hypothetical protein